jgi:DNA-binding NarL/FixJ family response regulator
LALVVATSSSFFCTRVRRWCLSRKHPQQIKRLASEVIITSALEYVSSVSEGAREFHMGESIRTFIVDDLRLLREGLASLLAEQEDITVIGTAACGSMALAKIKELRPEVALIDSGMPGKDGIVVTQALHQESPDVKVIILGLPDLTDEIMACIEAGAAGYVLKEASCDSLVETIRAVHRGESFCSPRLAASLFSRVAELAGECRPSIPQSSIKLTARELDIITEIAAGFSNKEIAQRLSIEPQTVKNHIHNILDKLQLHNRLETVHYAHERNLLKKQHQY